MRRLENSGDWEESARYYCARALAWEHAAGKLWKLLERISSQAVENAVGSLPFIRKLAEQRHLACLECSDGSLLPRPFTASSPASAQYGQGEAPAQENP
jgi:hypothetical protein